MNRCIDGELPSFPQKKKNRTLRQPFIWIFENQKKVERWSFWLTCINVGSCFVFLRLWGTVIRLPYFNAWFCNDFSANLQQINWLAVIKWKMKDMSNQMLDTDWKESEVPAPVCQRKLAGQMGSKSETCWDSNQPTFLIERWKMSVYLAAAPWLESIKWTRSASGESKTLE